MLLYKVFIIDAKVEEKRKRENMVSVHDIYHPQHSLNQNLTAFVFIVF